jgi:hypothetical protein
MMHQNKITFKKILNFLKKSLHCYNKFVTMVSILDADQVSDKNNNRVILIKGGNF